MKYDISTKLFGPLILADLTQDLTPGGEMEKWDFIHGFEHYLVGDLGHIQNYDTGRYLSLTLNNYGDLRATLVGNDGMKVTRSVRLLVAEAFVPGRTETFNAVINLDGIKTNCRANNLAWRPNWHAWKFAHQFRRDYPTRFYNVPIRNVQTGSIYSNTIECATTEGCVFSEIWKSIFNGVKVFPDGAVYERL